MAGMGFRWLWRSFDDASPRPASVLGCESTPARDRGSGRFLRLMHWAYAAPRRAPDLSRRWRRPLEQELGQNAVGDVPGLNGPH